MTARVPRRGTVTINDSNNMATAQPSVELLQRRVSEFSTCPICLDDIQNAKSLPCLHTFCLQCLKDFWKDRRPGHRVSCPVCRESFAIPQNGLDSLRTNFMVQNLVEVGSNQSADSRGNPCNAHPDKPAEWYCFNCEVTICKKCRLTTHKDHHSKGVETVSEEFSKSLEAITTPVLAQVDELQTLKEQLETTEWKCITTIKGVDIAAKQHGEKIKNTVDCQVGELLNELLQVKAAQQSETKSRKVAIDLAITKMQEFVESSRELRTKGSPCDIIRGAGVLLQQATQLLDAEVITCDNDAPVLTFLSMNIDELTRDGQNIVGRFQQQVNTDKVGNTVAMKEVFPQTKRERELELQLGSILRRLQSSSEWVAKEQVKLLEENRQAVEKFEVSEHGELMARRQARRILPEVQKTHGDTFEVKFQKQNRQHISEEYCQATERIVSLLNELSSNVLNEDRIKSMTKQDTATAGIEKLQDETRMALRNISEPTVEKLKTLFSADLPENQAHMALMRNDTIRDKLKTIEAREATWDTIQASVNEINSKLHTEVRRSEERCARVHTLINDTAWRFEDMQHGATTGIHAMHINLAAMHKREEVAKKECKMSSDRIETLRQQTEQLRKRQRWLDELKSTCGAQTCAHQLFIETSRKSDQLKEKLQQILKKEEVLLDKLQKREKMETSLREELESSRDKLIKSRDKINRLWLRPESAQELMGQLDKESKLQEKLEAALQQARCCAEYSETMKLTDKQVGSDLRQLLDQEKVFCRPVMQMKYRDSRMNKIQELSSDDGSQVLGMTAANGELYVLRYRNVVGQIDVYSTTDFNFLRQFTARDLSKPGIQDMKAENEATVTTIYLADSHKRCVQKVVEEDSGTSTITEWSVPGKPQGLSWHRSCLSLHGCLVVAYHHNSMLPSTGRLVFIRKGTVIREVVAQSLMASFWHAVPLMSGEFLISYRGYWCARGDSVGIMNYDGKVTGTRSYGNGWFTENHHLLRGAHQMAVDDDGFIFVADNQNNRVVLLNSSLQFVRYIATKNRPRWLHVDHVDRASRRLFVGHDSNTVSIIQLFD